ncbi:hypothetical protein [Bradyrhizobium sp. SEMIA]|uniref:hypothetical protein n=1 Tax=Bradyrhizobium sp. SEMIA TaxID=2597515 RepID=UPI0018A6434F|nr:hypothetical protein [Bradyrhizobium sp. SEMIA]QOG17260.1 hypothetical protein FOM02_07775 [Bradyrhizobium sp. SEMIA]
MPEGQYRIVKAQLPLIGGLAGHNFLALIDPDGNVIGELHGLATGADGLPKPIGHLPSDELRGYHDQHFYKPNFAQTELASGDQTEIMKRWSAGRAVLDKINELNIHYPWMGLGQNSNSFASTLIAAMGLTELPMPGGASSAPALASPQDARAGGRSDAAAVAVRVRSAQFACVSSDTISTRGVACARSQSRVGSMGLVFTAERRISAPATRFCRPARRGPFDHTGRSIRSRLAAGRRTARHDPGIHAQ